MRSLKLVMSGLLLVLLASCGGGGGCASSENCAAQGNGGVSAKQAIAVSIGSNAALASVDQDQRYSRPLVVSVADQSGFPVAGARVTPSVSIPFFMKGSFNRTGTPTVTVTRDQKATCPNEDVNQNDTLDPGEDVNGDGEISPRQSLVTVTPTSATTDANGVAFFQVSYFKSHATWMQYRFTAQAKVNTTEGFAVLNQATTFILGDDEAPGLVPFFTSPWGSGASCADRL